VVESESEEVKGGNGRKLWQLYCNCVIPPHKASFIYAGVDHHLHELEQVCAV
jgi:hypothetical protein